MLISTFNFIIGGIFKMDEIILRNENGQILASSREVADRFGA